MSDLNARVIAALERYGCTYIAIVKPKRGHPRVEFTYNGESYRYVLPGTTSDRNSWRNCLSDIRRTAGIVIERRKSNRAKTHRKQRRAAPLSPPSITPGPDMLAPLTGHPLMPRVIELRLDRAWRGLFADAMQRATGHRSAWPA